MVMFDTNLLQSMLMLARVHMRVKMPLPGAVSEQQLTGSPKSASSIAGRVNGCVASTQPVHPYLHASKRRQ